MKKAALIHCLEKLKEKHPLQFEDIDINCIELYLDISTEPEEVLEIIGANQNKFKLIVLTILSGDYDDELYRKEDDNIYAMRFRGKNNSRIYCKEVYEIGKVKKVIMSRALIHKTSQKNNKTNKPIIAALKGYTFECFQNYDDANEHKEKNKKGKS